MEMSNQIPVLTQNNWNTWKQDMQIILMHFGCWHFIIQTKPKEPEEGANYKEKYDFQLRKDRCYTLIYTNISADLKSLITETTDGLVAWNILKNHFEPVTRARVIQLLDEFFGTRYRQGEDIGIFISRAKTAATRLQEAGHKLNYLYIGFQLIGWLPREFQSAVQQIYRWKEEDFRVVKIEAELILEANRLTLMKQDLEKAEGVYFSSSTSKKKSWKVPRKATTVPSGAATTPEDLSVKVKYQKKDSKQSPRVSFKKTGAVRSKRPLELLHMDLCGPMPTESQGGNKYFLSIIDDYSRKVTVFPIGKKSDVFNTFVRFQKRAERFLNRKVIAVKTDGGLEFCNKDMDTFLAELEQYCKKHNIEYNPNLFDFSKEDSESQEFSNLTEGQLEANVVEVYIPNCYKQAIKSRDASKWCDAMDKEVNIMKELKVWDLVDPPDNAKILGNRCVYTIKRDENNKIVRCKARLVAQGNTQLKGESFDEVFSPVVNFTIIRLFFTICVCLWKWMRVQVDITNAYLYANLDSVIFMKQPTGYETDHNKRLYALEVQTPSVENLLEKRASEIEDEKEEAVQQQYVKHLEKLLESDKTSLPNLNTMKTRFGRLCYTMKDSHILKELSRETPIDRPFIMDLKSPPHSGKGVEEGFSVFLTDPLDSIVSFSGDEGQKILSGYSTTISVHLVKKQRTALHTAWHGLSENCPVLPVDPRTERFTRKMCNQLVTARILKRNCKCTSLVTFRETAERICEPSDVYHCLLSKSLKSNS
ncbi:Retrovirus-related Pol polyprotein like [Argiope bruennichi]|uniref:Retrovirus-related Pol polyprotein like n=1 Tax=Argiope bruennichi TaxID=94029 RepID=A0A8T0EDZ7_ARGBR|nr:Retrovirus-related Pol polyprotein like [Argiope bruennichi]